MANSNQPDRFVLAGCSFSPTSENPGGFSEWCVLAKLSTNPRNYS
ncbi:hypothetical protein SAMN03097699_1747 [Flavobacteriaceae bacterium MAR_2010_188]|nr:hypothetical protein SAMN03097699_1747 [Flavobacteriaceae bacterium MAR_2010_188]